jgi:hypothetical protein
MGKRERLLVLALLAAAVALAAWWWRVGPSARINREGYERLREGMTRADVEAALGVPPGDYATSQEARNHQLCIRNLRSVSGTLRTPLPPSQFEDTDDSWVEHWVSDESYVWVRFRRWDATVVVARIHDMPVTPVLDRIREWLGW